MTQYVLSTLKERRIEVRELLQAARSKISISVDVWTLSNYLSFLGVVAYFADADFKQHDIIIAFRNLYGDHTGGAQATILRAVFDEYDISHKISSKEKNSSKKSAKQFKTHIAKVIQLNFQGRHQLWSKRWSCYCAMEEKQSHKIET